jgi:L-ascorbate 6-phosphate lactonase
MGYVIESDRCAVYHSGDTLCYEGLLTTLRQWDLTVMFVPINGRDAVKYRRGTIGNMTYQEAVDLAGHLRPRLVVPCHWDMFASNSEDPQKFVDYLDAKFPGVKPWVGEHGAAVDVACGD